MPFDGRAEAFESRRIGQFAQRHTLRISKIHHHEVEPFAGHVGRNLPQRAWQSHRGYECLSGAGAPGPSQPFVSGNRVNDDVDLVAVVRSEQDCRQSADAIA